MKASPLSPDSEPGVRILGGPTNQSSGAFPLRLLFQGALVLLAVLVALPSNAWSRPNKKPNVPRTQRTPKKNKASSASISDQDRQVILHLKILLYMDMLEKLTLFEYLGLLQSLQAPAPDAPSQSSPARLQGPRFLQQGQGLWPAPMIRSTKK